MFVKSGDLGKALPKALQTTKFNYSPLSLFAKQNLTFDVNKSPLRRISVRIQQLLAHQLPDVLIAI
jgi:hypothetical protein